jgi:hypothetical protein
MLELLHGRYYTLRLFSQFFFDPGLCSSLHERIWQIQRLKPLWDASANGAGSYTS